MNKREFDVLYTIKKNGLIKYRDLSKLTNVSLGHVSKIVMDFKAQNVIDNSGITLEGIKLLEPYKVNNAVIMAAGMASRFVPLSLEMPKGLLKVKNEVLIERQIEQLKAKGINEIVIVLGYKKESFFYLEDKYDVKLIINPEFNKKNNIETLRLASEFIGNTYICSSDNYFATNVFEPYVFQSYYASIYVSERSQEWYMIPNKRGDVGRVVKTGSNGHIMLGHVYWNSEFSREFKKLIIKHSNLGDYDSSLWEQLFADYCQSLPPMAIKTYPNDSIFEFDSLDDLRKFDREYVSNTRSKIFRNICTVLHCDESDILNLTPIKEGLTNTSFSFEVKEKKYVYRHPGEGTEAIISRINEKTSLELAKSIDVDPTYIYMDALEGWKISTFVENFRVPDYSNFEDSKKVADSLRQLHAKNLRVGWQFLPWEEAQKIENILRENKAITMKDFDDLKAKIKKCFEKTIGDGIEKRFCHCDTYAPNWMLTEQKAILIDWEYAGYADPGNDLGAYMMDAMWDIDTSTKFIKYYCGDTYNETKLFHYLAYTALVSYYWFVWALYREFSGSVMGESLHNWYKMAKMLSEYLVAKYSL